MNPGSREYEKAPPNWFWGSFSLPADFLKRQEGRDEGAFMLFLYELFRILFLEEFSHSLKCLVICILTSRSYDIDIISGCFIFMVDGIFNRVVPRVPCDAVVDQPGIHLTE